jgi:divalent metal cation (Fe/Co/Zn/Cd) transporter
METAPPDDLQEQIRNAAHGVKGVKETEQCRVRKMGLEYYVDLHVKVDGSITVTEGHDIAHHVKDAVRQAIPEVADVLVHIEPA